MTPLEGPDTVLRSFRYVGPLDASDGRRHTAGRNKKSASNWKV